MAEDHSLEQVTYRYLRELLTDESDVDDLYDALSEVVPECAQGRREAVMAALEGSTASAVVAQIINLAANFCHMGQEIASFFLKRGLGAIGQIQLEHIAELSLDGLQSSWLPSAEVAPQDVIIERARAIANSVSGLTRRLDVNDLVYADRLELLMRVESRSDNILVGRTEQERVRTRNPQGTEYFSEGDHRAVHVCLVEISEVTKDLIRLPSLGEEVKSAFYELEELCTSVLGRMEAGIGIAGIQARSSVVSLADEISIYGTQARTLAAEAGATERAAQGYGSFLKTEFWKQRWRLYEIWLLTRVMEWLEMNGGEIEFRSVKNGSWQLPYGRATEPVALVHYPAGDARVFYQLYSSGTDAADMPDIAVFGPTGTAVVVLDPKHGRSYSRGKVQKVLERYVSGFSAMVTAVVNYFSMRSYAFDLVRARGKAFVLASNVRPESEAVIRLSLCIREALSAAGCLRSGAVELIRKSRAWSPCPDQLLFWARTSREIDEERGLWVYTQVQGPSPADGFAEYSSLRVEGAEGSECGSWVAFRAHRELLLVHNAPPDVSGVVQFEDPVEIAQWEPGGGRLLVKAGEHMALLDPRGRELRAWRAPTRHWKPLVSWIGRSGRILYAQRENLADIRVWVLDEKGTAEERLVFSPRRPALLDLRLLPSRSRRFAVLRATDFEWFIIGASSCRSVIADGNAPLSISRTGLLKAYPGPTSLRSGEGVRLLDIRGQSGGTQIPLIRFFGDISGGLKWSTDDSQIAFRVARQFSAGLDDLRIMVARVGDRDAASLSLPGQSPSAFAWLKGR